MTNKEKFIQLVSGDDTKTLEDVKNRIKNRAIFQESEKIALKVLVKLAEIGWSQKELSKVMKVSPQQITKIISGKENLTIETQIKLQNILDIPILASYYENKISEMDQLIITIEKKVEKIVAQAFEYSNNYQETKVLKLEKTDYSQEYYQPVAV